MKNYGQITRLQAAFGPTTPEYARPITVLTYWNLKKGQIYPWA
jgi:hypothetical protein